MWLYIRGFFRTLFAISLEVGIVFVVQVAYESLQSDVVALFVTLPWTVWIACAGWRNRQTSRSHR